MSEVSSVVPQPSNIKEFAPIKDQTGREHASDIPAKKNEVGLERPHLYFQFAALKDIATGAIVGKPKSMPAPVPRREPEIHGLAD